MIKISTRFAESVRIEENRDFITAAIFLGFNAHQITDYITCPMTDRTRRIVIDTAISLGMDAQGKDKLELVNDFDN